MVGERVVIGKIQPTRANQSAADPMLKYHLLAPKLGRIYVQSMASILQMSTLTRRFDLTFDLLQSSMHGP